MEDFEKFGKKSNQKDIKIINLKAAILIFPCHFRIKQKIKDF